MNRHPGSGHADGFHDHSHGNGYALHGYDHGNDNAQWLDSIMYSNG
jgi:hypothetical protein